MLEKTDTNTGSRPDLPFELSDFESGIANVQSVLEHELHSEVDLAHLFGHSASTSTSPKSFKAVTGTCTTANGGGDASRSSKSPQPSSSKDECLQRLSQLSSKLLVCFSKTENRHVALEDILAYPSPEMSCNAHDGDDQGLHTAKNIIGELLESSQVFLETLEQLKSLEASQQEPQHPYSPSSSEYLYLDSPDEADFLSKESSTPFPAFAPRNSDNDNSHEMATKLSSDKTSRYPCKSANAFSTNVCFSMPTIFTIVTCYMWLFQGYEVVFSAIQESLLLQKQTQEDQQRKEQQRQQCDISSYHYVQKRRQASSSSTPVSRTGKTGPGALCPTVLPNIQFGGFGLDGHPNLQIEMLIHVSSQMLQKIENIMGFDTATAQNHPPPPPPSPCREHGLLDLGCAPTQLYAYLHGARHGAAESPSSGRSALVKDMVKTIRQILSSSHC
nr:C6 finger domain-containing protein [Colletotrichum truncatum]KAF6783834.1 C6 finger domain-containing protein [Colletotrichum truncatum]